MAATATERRGRVPGGAGVRIAGLAAGAAAAGALWAVAETRWFVLRRVTVPVLPEGSHPLRVLHLSDLHLVPSQRVKRRWVAGLAALEPDLVVDTGDNLGGPGSVPAVLETFGGLLDRPGVFVAGSNDYYAPIPKNPARYLLAPSSEHGGRAPHEPLPWRDLEAGFAERGWAGLRNRTAALRVGDVELSFKGVDDPHLERDAYPEGPWAGGPAVLRIGVAHAPYRRVLDRMTADGADLVLAGHTHGGQLRVPGLGALVTNCDLDRGRARGLSRWTAGDRTSWLHVSAGLGTSPYAQVRFACRPEATLLTLVPR